MQVIIPDSEKVGLLGVMVKVHCKVNFYHQWGVYLYTDGSFPPNWDICLKCLGQKSYISGIVKEQVKKDGNQSI